MKHAANPMISEDREYEMRIDNGQPSVWFFDGKWRAWYSAFTSCSKPRESVPYCNNAPQTCGTASPHKKAERGTALLYAESDDCVVWRKPDLGLTSWNGSTANNLVELGGMTTGVYLDENAPRDERYKLVTGSNDAGLLALSADGLTWGATKDLAPQAFGRWDTPKNIVWDEERAQWILYDRSQPTPDSIRIQSYTHSLTADFMGDWSPTMPTGLNSSKDYQPDGLVVWPYAGIFLGLGNVFNPTQSNGTLPVGQVNAVLGWSADGRRWKWLRPNDSLIPLGAPADFDACGVFGAKQEPLRTATDDELRLYYVGCNGPSARVCSEKANVSSRPKR